VLYTVSQELSFACALRVLDPSGRERWHGHNVTLRVSVNGQLGTAGIIVPAGALSDWLHDAVAPYDHAQIDTGEPAPDMALAHLAYAVQQRLSRTLLAGAALVSLTLSHAALGVTRCSSQTLYRYPGDFSAAHRTHAPRLSAAENLALYGICNNPAGHGHNYRAAIWHPSPAAVPTSVWAELDHKHLSVDFPDLVGRNVVTETIAARLGHRVPGVARARVWETPAFFAEWWPAGPHFRLGRLYSFSAAHQLASSSEDALALQALYGPCGRPGIHGHDFHVLILVTGELDERTETAFDLGELDRLAAARLAPLQLANLSADIAGLAGAATPARLAQHLFTLLSQDLGPPLRAVGVSTAPGRWNWAEQGNHG
jgi:6-pyruvoyltetrahydropterin/6-carboxytetrahydropterin synthase